MKQHTVPQNIMSVEFKIFGDLNVRQFTYITIAGALAFIFYLAFPNIIGYPLVIVTLILGVLITFAKINERPFDVWVNNFLTAILLPTQRIWFKEPQIPFYLVDSEEKVKKESEKKDVKEDKVSVFLKTRNLPTDENSKFNTKLDIEEIKTLTNIDRIMQMSAISVKANSYSNNNSAQVHNTSNLSTPVQVMADFPNVSTPESQPTDTSMDIESINEDKKNDNVVLPNTVFVFNNPSSSGAQFVPILDEDVSLDGNEDKQEKIKEKTPIKENVPQEIPVKESNDGLIMPNSQFSLLSNKNKFDGVKDILPENIDDYNTVPIEKNNIEVKNPLPVVNPAQDTSFVATNTANSTPLPNDMANNLTNGSNQVITIDPNSVFSLKDLRKLDTSMDANTIETLKIPEDIQKQVGSNVKEPQVLIDEIVEQSSDVLQPVQIDTKLDDSLKKMKKEEEDLIKLKEENEKLKEELINKKVVEEDSIKKKEEDLLQIEEQNKTLQKNLTDKQEEINKELQEKDKSLMSVEEENKKLQEEVEKLKNQMNTLSMDGTFQNIKNNNQSQNQFKVMAEENRVLKNRVDKLENDDTASQDNIQRQENLSLNNNGKVEYNELKIGPMPDFTKYPNVISGVIADSKNNLIEDVVIIIKDKSKRIMRAMRSNLLGQFYSRNPLVNGVYDIEANKEGFVFEPVNVILMGNIVNPIIIKTKSIKNNKNFNFLNNEQQK